MAYVSRRVFLMCLILLIQWQTSANCLICLEGEKHSGNKNHIKDGWNFFSSGRNEATIGREKRLNGREAACFDQKIGALFDYERCVSPGSDHLVGTGRTKTSDRILSIPLFFDIGDDEFITNSISECAFMNFIDLEEIEIPSSVSIIGRSAFRGCRSLRKFVYRGNHPLNIEHSTSIFEGTSSSLVIEVSPSYKSDRFLGQRVSIRKLSANTKTGTVSHPIFTGSGELTTDITQFCNAAGNQNLVGWDEITAVTIKGYSIVGEYAFSTINQDNAKLKQINLGATITRLKKEAFRGAAIEYIKLPMAVSVIEQGVFNNCRSLKRVIFLGNVTNIGNYQFGRTPLQTVDYCGVSASEITNSDYMGSVPNTLEILVTNRYSATKFLNKEVKDTLTLKPTFTEENVEYEIFEHEMTLTCQMNAVITREAFERVLLGEMRCGCNDYDEFFSLSITGQAATIENDTFSQATSLTRVSFEDSITEIGPRAFKGTKISSIELPTSCVSVGDECFNGITQLTSARLIGPTVFGSSVFVGSRLSTLSFESTDSYTFGQSCFEGVSDFASLSFRSSVNIGESAFKGCTGITSVTFDNKLVEAGGSCFEGCTGIESIIFPGEVTIGSSTFTGCTSLKRITFKGNIRWKQHHSEL